MSHANWVAFALLYGATILIIVSWALYELKKPQAYSRPPSTDRIRKDTAYGLLLASRRSRGR